MTRKLALLPFILLIAVTFLCFVFPNLPKQIQTGNINTADTSWMLTATGLVLLMTPGLAFFYGGMVNKKNVLSTMLQAFIAMAVIVVVWIVFGFSLAFGDSVGGIVGDPSTFFLMKNVLDGEPWKLAPTIPFILFAFFQLKFAIIAPALITGALPKE